MATGGFSIELNDLGVVTDGRDGASEWSAGDAVAAYVKA